jgi:hypothetical protein
MSNDKRELSHNQFRRPYDELRGRHHDYRRTDDDRVFVPSVIRNNTSGGGKEGDKAGK